MTRKTQDTWVRYYLMKQSYRQQHDILKGGIAGSDATTVLDTAIRSRRIVVGRFHVPLEAGGCLKTSLATQARRVQFNLLQ